MKQDGNTSKVSLEDLLRFKRAERPPTEFWNRFEEELRARQLAAIVARPRWWESVVSALSGRRMVAAFGGAAALAVALVVAFQLNQPDEASANAVGEVAAVKATLPPAAREAAAKPVAASNPRTVVSNQRMRSSEKETAAFEEAVDAAQSSPPTVAAAVSSQSDVRSSSSVLPVASVANVSFDAVVLPPPQNVAPTANASYSVASYAPAEGSSEPLAGMSSPREMRLARMGASYPGNGMEVASATLSVSSNHSRSVRDLDLRESKIGRLTVQDGGFNFRL